MGTFFGFALTQTYSSLVKVSVILINKMNLGQFSAKRRLGTHLKDASADSKEMTSILLAFMGNDVDIDEDDREYGTLLLSTLESWIKGARYLLQRSWGTK